MCVDLTNYMKKASSMHGYKRLRGGGQMTRAVGQLESKDNDYHKGYTCRFPGKGYEVPISGTVVLTT